MEVHFGRIVEDLVRNMCHLRSHSIDERLQEGSQQWSLHKYTSLVVVSYTRTIQLMTDLLLPFCILGISVTGVIYKYS